MIPGPNSITNKFTSIWTALILFPHIQIFQRGAYYAVEVCPGRGQYNVFLRLEQGIVTTLGTCSFIGSRWALEPGECKVWISGRVPPSPGNYFPECVCFLLVVFCVYSLVNLQYVRYVELVLISSWATSRGKYIAACVSKHRTQEWRYSIDSPPTIFFLEANDLELIEQSKVANNDDLFEALADLRRFRK
ncbi:hypothetical protein B0H17DRAFT_278979 [Mycena rosella]|uniref:Uncharacterized protein n=1 Tax=Mycena rosella TaxID=1033263 RepID=A0AAD7DVQ6_MYCRO|nr:hypothetical protein B0H17DRAFT_278979 [Mycena rosella]